MNLLDALPGAWEGPGEGHYSTIEPFAYRERLTFSRLGDKPIIAYAQRTTRTPTAVPLHAEAGYLRVDGDRVELMVAQPTGFAEVHHGIVIDGVIDFGITVFGRSVTALPVQSVRRRWELHGDRLTVDLWMSYRAGVDEHHLRSVLDRDRAIPDV